MAINDSFMIYHTTMSCDSNLKSAVIRRWLFIQEKQQDSTLYKKLVMCSRKFQIRSLTWCVYCCGTVHNTPKHRKRFSAVSSLSLPMVVLKWWTKHCYLLDADKTFTIYAVLLHTNVNKHSLTNVILSAFKDFYKLLCCILVVLSCQKCSHLSIKMYATNVWKL